MKRPAGFVALVLLDEIAAVERAFAKADLDGSTDGWHTAVASCDDWSCAWITNGPIEAIGIAIGFQDEEILKARLRQQMTNADVHFESDKIGELTRVFAWIPR